MLDEDWLDRLHEDVAEDTGYEREMIDESFVDNGDEDEGPEIEKSDIEEPDIGVLEEPDIDFKADFKQSKHTSYGRVGEGGRGSRTALESTLDTAAGILIKSFDVSQGQIRTILDELENIKNIHLLHIETIIMAVLWKNKKLPLKKENLVNFHKKYDKVSVEISDLLRYIRYLNVIKSA